MKAGDVYKLEYEGIKHRFEVVEISHELNEIYGDDVVLVMTEDGSEHVINQYRFEETCTLDEESPNRKEN
jgi:hypothetical protein